MVLLSFKEMVERKNVISENKNYSLKVSKDKEINIYEDREFRASFVNSTGTKISIEIDVSATTGRVRFYRNGKKITTISDLEDWKDIVYNLVKSVENYIAKYRHRLKKMEFYLNENKSSVNLLYVRELKGLAQKLDYKFETRVGSGNDVDLMVYFDPTK